MFVISYHKLSAICGFPRMGLPLNHSFKIGMFHEINHPFRRCSIYGNPIFAEEPHFTTWVVHRFWAQGCWWQPDEGPVTWDGMGHEAGACWKRHETMFFRYFGLAWLRSFVVLFRSNTGIASSSQFWACQDRGRKGYGKGSKGDSPKNADHMWLWCGYVY